MLGSDTSIQKYDKQKRLSCASAVLQSREEFDCKIFIYEDHALPSKVIAGLGGCMLLMGLGINAWKHCRP